MEDPPALPLLWLCLEWGCCGNKLKPSRSLSAAALHCGLLHKEVIQMLEESREQPMG